MRIHAEAVEESRCRILGADRRLQEHHMKSVWSRAAIFVLLAAYLLMPGCSTDDRYRSLKIEDCTRIVQLNFFDGSWWPTTVENPRPMQIDIVNKSLVSHGKREEIVDIVPVDYGYAIHVSDHTHRDHPEGIQSIFVLKQLDKHTIALIESPDLVSVFSRHPR